MLSKITETCKDVLLLELYSLSPESVNREVAIRLQKHFDKCPICAALAFRFKQEGKYANIPSLLRLLDREQVAFR